MWTKEITDMIVSGVWYPDRCTDYGIAGTIIGWKPAYDCTGSNTRRYIIARIFKLFTILRKEQK